MNINRRENFHVSPSQEESLGTPSTSSPSPNKSFHPIPFGNHSVTSVEPPSSRKRTVSDAGLFSDAHDDKTDPLVNHHITPVSNKYQWNPEKESPVHVTDFENSDDESTKELEEALDQDGLLKDFEEGDLTFDQKLEKPALHAAKRPRWSDAFEDHEVSPISNEYTWNPATESVVHDEHIGQTDTESRKSSEETLFDSAPFEDSADIFDQPSTSFLASSSTEVPTKRRLEDPLLKAASKIEITLQENHPLSHEEAMQIARATLAASEGITRTTEAKAFKVVAQVFNKLLHKNSSLFSPDAHLKNQDHVYAADMEAGLAAGLSKKNAYQLAILRAGQRSFYFNPKQNMQEAQNQARTGMEAARQYFLRKGISYSSLPTLQELLPQMMTTKITTH